MLIPTRNEYGLHALPISRVQRFIDADWNCQALNTHGLDTNRPAQFVYSILFARQKSSIQSCCSDSCACVVCTLMMTRMRVSTFLYRQSSFAVQYALSANSFRFHLAFCWILKFHSHRNYVYDIEEQTFRTNIQIEYEHKIK